MPRPYSLVSLATLWSCLLLTSPPAIAQDPSAVLLLLEEQSAVLRDRLRDVLDRDLETERELLDAILDLRATAEAMEAEKGLILNAFRRKPPNESSASLTWSGNWVIRRGPPRCWQMSVSDCWTPHSCELPKYGNLANDPVNRQSQAA